MQIPYINGVGEVLIFSATLVGAGLGFLWFNSYPAQVFMGDVGALAIGASLGTMAVIVRQEIVLFVMGGVFVLETVSVMLQVASFKLTGKRIFRMAPDSSSFRTQRMGRAESHRALLDHQLRAGVGGSCNLEDPLMSSVVVGLGKTGASCVRYLAKRGDRVSATDSRRAPPGLAELGDLAAAVDLRLGGFDLSLLEGASQVLMSPGVSLEEPIARAARARGIEVLGDVELFARAVHAPVIGITGTNGKSTVTTLVARMAAAAGSRVLAGGNLGEPALDLLEQPKPGFVRARTVELSIGNHRLAGAARPPWCSTSRPITWTATRRSRRMRKPRAESSPMQRPWC